MVVFLVKPVSGWVYLGYVGVFIEIQYRFKSKFAFNLSYCVQCLEMSIPKLMLKLT